MTKGFLCGHLFLFVGAVCKTRMPRLRMQCPEMLDSKPVPLVGLLGRSCWELLGLGTCPVTPLRTEVRRCG